MNTTTLNIGLVGLDSSHVVGFLDAYLREDDPHRVPGVNIARALPGGSPAFSMSRERVAGFTEEVEKRGVALVDSLDRMDGLDGYLLLSVDGNQHYEQFASLARFGRPVFIDKPLACSYADARRILDLSRRERAPMMTASSMRYVAGIADVLPAGEKVTAAEGFGPMAFLPDYRDYFWYGIHTAEIVYRFLGRGCVEVRAFSGDAQDVLAGRWTDGRVGLACGNRTGANNFGVRLTTDKGHFTSLHDEAIPCLPPLADAIERFIRAGASPIDLEESVECIGFLEAASRSRAAGDEPVALASLA